jgi:hypothetical protein
MILMVFHLKTYLSKNHKIVAGNKQERKQKETNSFIVPSSSSLTPSTYVYFIRFSFFLSLQESGFIFLRKWVTFIEVKCGRWSNRMCLPARGAKVYVSAAAAATWLQSLFR